MKRLAALCVVALIMTLISRVPLWGHATLVRADPAPGAAVKVGPKIVRAWFPEELDAKRSTLSVWDANGRRVDDTKGGVDLDDLDRKSMLARLRPLALGSYTVKWRAVSADDLNVAQGSYRFRLIKP